MLVRIGLFVVIDCIVFLAGAGSGLGFEVSLESIPLKPILDCFVTRVLHFAEIPFLLDVDRVRSTVDGRLAAVTFFGSEFFLDLLQREVREEDVGVASFLHRDFVERVFTGTLELREDTSALRVVEGLGLTEDVLRDLRFFVGACYDRL